MKPLNVFIGYDSREPVAYHVLAHSILARASVPVAITPLVQSALRSSGLYTRVRGPSESTEFSLTRFLVPYLSDFKGTSIFMDCDMLVRCDIAEVPQPTESAVLVCQHDYTPKTTTKFLGQKQTNYPCKNWSSMMVLNNERCSVLTPEYVNRATGLELHRFLWIPSVGAMPLEYNWLVGEYESNAQAKILHWTMGGPWFAPYRDCDHAGEWMAEHAAMAHPHT